MTVAEHLGRQTRYKLFCLVHRMVKEATDRERERLKKEHKRVGKGRPGYDTKTAELLGISRETVQAWKRRKYQAKNVNAERLVNVAYGLNKEETAEILQEDVESHRERLEKLRIAITKRSGPDSSRI